MQLGNTSSRVVHTMPWRGEKTWLRYGVVLLLAAGSALTFGSWPSVELGERAGGFTIETEPVALRGHTHRAGIDTEYGHSVFAYRRFTVPDDFWVEGFESEMVNAPEEVIHHGELMYADQPDPECPMSPDGTTHTREPIWFVSNLNLNRTFRYPPPYGVYLPKGTELILVGMFHNPDPEREYRRASLRFTIRGRTDIAPDGQHRHVRYYRIMSEACQRGNTFIVPPATRDFVRKRQRPPFAMSEGGTIVLLYPHFHFWQEGKFQAILVNGTVRWKFYAPDPGSTFFRPDPPNPNELRVAKGDQLDFVTVYDNTTDVLNPDAMAAFTFLLVPDEPR